MLFSITGCGLQQVQDFALISSTRIFLAIEARMAATGSGVR
jgi:hypothetical protein